MIAIETRDLTRQYGKITAVDKLNLSIPAGSLYGLIGPNGAGKTTSLRMLAGLLEPTSGEILINEQRTNHHGRDLQWMIGYMPDFFGVYDDLLVWEYLDFFARCYNLSSKRRVQVVEELLELVDLNDKREAYVQTLSRGIRQRLCLAHALVHDPQVLLLDEPASGLDPRARVEMRELLKELGSMGKTIVLSSHILSELAELCDAIGIIEKGQLVASGPIAAIRAQMKEVHRIQVRILNDHDAAEALLRNQPGVGEIVRFNGSLEIEFNGDEDAAADLLECLVVNKVRIASFNEMATGLEEIFLRLTKGEVA
jgi:ABC-2 type transport system ATP-binding protein